MNNQNIEPLTVQQLLSKDQYRIPIYQRNYDWSEKEALQLMEDIADYAALKSDTHYYLGSVVVFIRNKNGESFYETIDGQQRLTTLTILMNVLCTEGEISERMKWFSQSNLSYDHRTEADEAIRMLKHGQLSSHPSGISISDVYQIAKKNLRKILIEKGLDIHQFVDFLLNKVIVMRIPLPKDTELNHYFEIMNSRGEQLEKHEVLKADLMKELEDDPNERMLFNAVWEACADMSRYVLMNLPVKLRLLVFNDAWLDLNYGTDEFNRLAEDYKKLDSRPQEKDNNEDIEDGRSLSQLFEDARKNVKYSLPHSGQETENTSDRFDSILNFPNFLLHVLKVMYQRDKEYQKEIDQEIKLDDKRLLSIFLKVISKCMDKKGFVKRFLMALLKTRHLFDLYVIKRENLNNRTTWSLKKIEKVKGNQANRFYYVGTFSNSENEDDLSKDIRMLEAMFHVSAPTQIYKHWLNAVLHYVYNIAEKVEPSAFRDMLYTLACTYMIDRYLCDEATEFEEIIYKNCFKAFHRNINWENLDKGCLVENFIFNFYDYIVWKGQPSKYAKFEFTYRTSVEHFYPQTPMKGYEVLNEETGLHHFGNLCLISRGMNSKFSNNMPMAKLNNFGNEESLKELSIKLMEMMDRAREKRDWGKDEIFELEGIARQRINDAITAVFPR